MVSHEFQAVPVRKVFTGKLNGKSINVGADSLAEALAIFKAMDKPPEPPPNPVELAKYDLKELE